MFGTALVHAPLFAMLCSWWIGAISLKVEEMNGGVGPHSYVKNSSFQGSVVDAAKLIITDEISKKLDVERLRSISPNNSLYIADFGCAAGDNSFAAILTITNAIEKKLLLLNPENKIPEFHVFFNDRITNDFNTLFSSLPAVRNYHAAGVPGTFFGRLFPSESLHFFYSSWSLHWLSRVPEASSMNKWKAYSQLRDGEYVIDSAYSQQFRKDIGKFLECRAKEVVVGGMAALLIPGVPHTINPETDYVITQAFSVLGYCLQDMANEGRIDEAKVESFNFPMYYPTAEELEAVILERSPCFGIERMEILKDTGRHALPNPKAVANTTRPVTEELLTAAFGTEIDMDELFDRYANKMAISSYFLDPDNSKVIVILVILTRKPN